MHKSDCLATRSAKRILSLLLSLCLIVTLLPSEPVFASSNEQIIFDYFHNTMGLNEAAACGVLANIYCESSFNPNATGDGGTSYGICQWHNSRWDNLKSYCNKNGYDWTTLTGQLHYLEYELTNSYPSVYSTLKNATNDEDGAYNAGYKWCYSFEIPANYPSVAVTRGNLAKNTYWPKYKPSNVSIQATSSNYNVGAAIAYADAHWNDGVGLCAEFVCKCLNAGGITGIPNYSYYSSSDLSYCGRQYGVYTNPYTCSAPLLKWLSTKYTVIKSPSYSDMERGDVVFMNDSSGHPDGHVGIITGFSGSTPLYSAHNNDRHNASIGNQATYVVKMKGVLNPISPYANLGESFYAVILNSNCWKPISLVDGSENIFLETEVGDANNKWHFVQQSDGSYIITSCENGKALEMTDGLCTSGTQMTAHSSWQGSYQKWFLIPYKNGYIFECKHFQDEEWVMDLRSNDSSDHTPIQINKRNNSDAQIWSIYAENDVQLGPSVLSVAVVSPTVTFTWERRYGVSEYNLRIWKGTVSNGTEYKSKWDTYSGVQVNLPAGNYYAYVDTCDYYQYFASNYVSFSVPQKQYLVTFNANGGITDIVSKNIVYGEKYGSLPNASRNGYQFDGWYSEATDGTRVTGDSVVTTAGSHTLYAQWTSLCPNGHNYSYKTTTVPTTSATGILTGTCSRCKGTTTITLPKLNTTDYSYSITKAATCTATGTGRYTWKTTTYGSFYFDVTIGKTAHSYKAVVTAPSCTEKGYTTHTCTVCGDSYTDTQKAALGHDWNAGVVTKEATEKTDGLRTYACKRCSATKTEVIPAVAHVHDYKEVVTPPTCTEQGYTTHTCACGDSYKDSTTAALGHSYGSWKSEHAATCATAGKEFRTCSRCQNRETHTIEALGHIESEWITDSKPTCTASGTKHTECTRCGSLIQMGTTSATGHQESAWIIDKNASCTASGSKHTECAVCGASIQIAAINALGHDYVVTVVEPTCTERGYTKMVCSRCGDSSIDHYVAELDHSWSQGVVMKEPAETTEGIRSYTCTRCNTVRTEAIPPIIHTHSFVETVVMPTCTAQGYTVFNCECGYSYTDHYSDALGHEWNDGTITLQPTETQSGVRTYICNRCGEIKTDLIQPTAHTHKYAAQTTAPICTEAGFTTYTCDCGDSYTADISAPLGHSFVDGVCTRCGYEEIQTAPHEEICPSKQFRDSPVYGNWAHEGIDYCVANKLMNGVGNDLFNPNGTVTRAQLVTILYRVANQPTVTTVGTFDDVPTGKWYSDAIEWAAANSIVNGVGNGKFNPMGNITREQIAAILYRYEGSPKVNGTLAGFPDSGNVHAYAENALIWATGEGLINGIKSDGITNLAPQNNATRAQIASIIMRYLES